MIVSTVLFLMHTFAAVKKHAIMFGAKYMTKI